MSCYAECAATRKVICFAKCAASQNLGYAPAPKGTNLAEGYTLRP